MTTATVAIVLILWLVCAIATGLIGTSKGLSFGAFFVIGLLLGIIGVVIALFAKPAEPTPGTYVAAGWYADPWGRKVYRYHDGRAWTEHESNGQDQLSA